MSDDDRGRAFREAYVAHLLAVPIEHPRRTTPLWNELREVDRAVWVRAALMYDATLMCDAARRTP